MLEIVHNKKFLKYTFAVGIYSLQATVMSQDIEIIISHKFNFPKTNFSYPDILFFFFLISLSHSPEKHGGFSPTLISSVIMKCAE